MFTFRVCALLLAAGVCIAEVPRLGEPVPHRIAKDMTVMPDGTGLPRGSGSAIEGEAVYQQHCLACHGEDGKGGLNDRLAGGAGTLTSGNPVKTIGSYWPYATTVFAYVRRTMPYATPGVLDDDALYAVTAYLLYLNDIIAQDTVMDAKSLPSVTMPNRNGFDAGRWQD